MVPTETLCLTLFSALSDRVVAQKIRGDFSERYQSGGLARRRLRVWAGEGKFRRRRISRWRVVRRVACTTRPIDVAINGFAS